MRVTFKNPLRILKFRPPPFNFGLEQQIRKHLDSLPSVERIYTEPDGSPRTPLDDEFKTLALLQSMYYQRNYLQWNFIIPGRIPREQLLLFVDNSQDLAQLQFVTKDLGVIIDKIPYRDEATGALKWRVVRQTEKQEGWEFPLFYIVLPVFAYVCYSKYTSHMKRRAMEGPDWADKELRLRAMEDYFHGDTAKALEFLSNENKSEREVRDRDDLVVARILAGDYDRLGQIKKPLPERFQVHKTKNEWLGI